MKKSLEHIYTSAGCNRIPEIVDWNNEGLICYGASNAVVIYNTNEKNKDPITVLSFHRQRVNSVKWIYKPDGSCNELISCSADKTAATWRLVDGIWKATRIITGHSDGITSIAALYTSDTELTVFTGSIDSTIRVWISVNDIMVLYQIITLNSGICLTLTAHFLPKTNKTILICALDDHKIHIFAKETEYQRVHSLVGHEDWVRGLDVLDIDDSTILLASASQDTYIRLWRIQQHTASDEGPKIKMEEKLFNAYGFEWSVKLDAVLAGHEGWVYGVQWQPGILDKTTDKKQPIYRLLSSSLDKTLIIWEPENEGEGVWVERVRVGEVGGNGLGFYGSRFGPSGRSFLGHGYNGSFHIWSLDQETNQWSPQVVCGGHFNAVEDVRWEGRGRYIVSVSTDQTTRLHAPWTKPDGGVEWHEIARPQVHGYDMASLALVSSDVFASAAEEKVIRVFQAPHNFRTNFKNIVGEALIDDQSRGPEGASVPSLGLSNKAVYTGEKNQPDTEDDNDGYFIPVELKEPPTEETLMQNTLWPETHKLYGHGYEVFALDASSDGTLLASACKATVAEHAAVLIWDTKTWQQIQNLVSHSLTVTRLAFSPDSRQLLSVSRDRRWTLSQRGDDNRFTIIANTDKSNGIHTRIIWCCAWSHDSSIFATGSREGKVCVWSKTDTLTDTSLKQHALYGKPLELANNSVTALAFGPKDGSSKIVAVGLESGAIKIYGFDGMWDLLTELDNSAAHHLTVKTLAFRPQEKDNKEILLASCGTDHLVRIYKLYA